jgi:hypothetical protein
MSVQSDNYTCDKCGHSVPSFNKTLHSVQCKGSTQSNRTEPIFNHSNLIQQREILDSTIRQRERISENNLNNMNLVPQESEEFYHCEKCDVYMNLEDKLDHILKDQRQDQGEQPTNLDELHWEGPRSTNQRIDGGQSQNQNRNSKYIKIIKFIS